jgi:2-polyprenyl-6-methoxyphenol hydroxylase-like FAD-dependent oxidoreductase
MDGNETSVLIIGAGVAGLSLAIMLAERTIACQVLESRQRFDGPTSGVRISGEGVRILRSMGLAPIGEETLKVEMRCGGLTARFTAPGSDTAAIVVTRLALHEQLMLRAQALGIPVVTGFKVSSVGSSAAGVQVTSEAGETVRGWWARTGLDRCCGKGLIRDRGPRKPMPAISAWGSSPRMTPRLK